MVIYILNQTCEDPINFQITYLLFLD